LSAEDVRSIVIDKVR